MDRHKIKVCYVSSVDITLKFLLLNQLKFLQEKNYQVFAACSDGKWISDIEKEGIKVEKIRIKRKFFSPFSDLAALIKLFFYFKKEKFDIVHTHTPKAGLLGQIAAKMAGVPIIINTIHGFYFTKRTDSLKRRIFILIEKAAAGFSSLIFFVNREDMQTARKEKICRPELIKYFGGAIDTKRFDPTRFSKNFILEKKKSLGIGLDDKVIGIVARLVKEKGYVDLFRAFFAVSKVFPKAVLLIAGSLEPEKRDAIDFKAFEKYCLKNRVIYLGERTDIDEIYAVIDIFVLPSYREGLGISILEASAMEKPVIATDIRGCREAVDGGKTGIFVPLRSPAKLREEMIYLLCNPKIAEEMGKNGRIKVMAQFDEKFVFAKIEEAYKSLLTKMI